MEPLGSLPFRRAWKKTMETAKNPQRGRAGRGTATGSGGVLGGQNSAPITESGARKETRGNLKGKRMDLRRDSPRRENGWVGGQRRGPAPTVGSARKGFSRGFDRVNPWMLEPPQWESVYLFAFEPPQGKVSQEDEVTLLPAAGVVVVLGEESVVQSGVGRPPELQRWERRSRKPE